MREGKEPIAMREALLLLYTIYVSTTIYVCSYYWYIVPGPRALQ
jgi:hypothetical protein